MLIGWVSKQDLVPQDFVPPSACMGPEIIQLHIEVEQQYIWAVEGKS